MLIQKKHFDDKPVSNKKILKTKTITDFYDKEIPKMGFNHTCSAVISFDSALKKDENSFSQVFLKECKWIDKKVIRHLVNVF